MVNLTIEQRSARAIPMNLVPGKRGRHVGNNRQCSRRLHCSAEPESNLSSAALPVMDVRCVLALLLIAPHIPLALVFSKGLAPPSLHRRTPALHLAQKCTHVHLERCE
eukprot:1160558-Pelagomonas_calceolata.AAC.4